MMKNLLVFVGLCSLISSCEIHSEYNFNKDFSGSYAFTLDMSQLMSLGQMAGENNSEEELGFSLDDESIAQLESQLNAMEGISDAIIHVDEGKMDYQFNFEQPEDIENSGVVLAQILAEAMSEDSVSVDSILELGSEMMLPQEFEYKKKSFYFVLNRGANNAFKEEELKDLPLDFFNIKFTFSFKRKIKAIELSGFKISSKTDRKISLDLPITDVQSNPWVRLKLK